VNNQGPAASRAAEAKVKRMIETKFLRLAVSLRERTSPTENGQAETKVPIEARQIL
jgi:hypothetical protein